MADEPTQQKVILDHPDNTALYAEVECENHGTEIHVFYSIPAMAQQFSETIAANRALIALLGGDEVTSARLDGQADVISALLDTQDALASQYRSLTEGLSALEGVTDIGDMFSN